MNFKKCQKDPMLYSFKSSCGKYKSLGKRGDICHLLSSFPGYIKSQICTWTFEFLPQEAFETKEKIAKGFLESYTALTVVSKFSKYVWVSLIYFSGKQRPIQMNVFWWKLGNDAATRDKAAQPDLPCKLFTTCYMFRCSKAQLLNCALKLTLPVTVPRVLMSFLLFPFA